MDQIPNPRLLLSFPLAQAIEVQVYLSMCSFPSNIFHIIWCSWQIVVVRSIIAFLEVMVVSLREASDYNDYL